MANISTVWRRGSVVSFCAEMCENMQRHLAIDRLFDVTDLPALFCSYQWRHQSGCHTGRSVPRVPSSDATGSYVGYTSNIVYGFYNKL